MANHFIKSSIVMDSFYFEERRKRYLELSSKEKSIRILLFELISFLKELLSQENDLLKEVYVIETMPDLISLSEIYSAYGVEPNKSVELIETVEKLNPFIKDNDSKIKIAKHILRIKEELKSLKFILDGKVVPPESNTISFPVLERTNSKSEAYGMVEQLEISINTNKKNDRLEFNLIPSLPKIDEKLKIQIDNSWGFAIKYLKNRHKKVKSNLVVTIKFINKLGIYEGDSLGAALTIRFIQELFRYYDLREEISYESNIIITGSMNEGGQIGEVEDEIIKAKVETSFYSLGEMFLVPQKDLDSAFKKFEELQAKYPKRKLRVLPIGMIEDAITRRDVLNIEKQNIVHWGSKKLIKNKLSIALLILLLGTLLGFYYVNQDNNPDHISIIENGFQIKNKYDKILWDIKREVDFQTIHRSLMEKGTKIVDVDGDGINEVLFMDSPVQVVLYNKNRQERWTYKFKYPGLSKNGVIFNDNFIPHSIVDIYKKENTKIAVVYYQHTPYYPNPVIKLDLSTGKRIEDIFWHSGALRGGFIYDIDNDGKDEVILSGIHNGLKSAVLCSIELDKLKGQSPSRENYYLDGIEIADVEHYIKLPKPDILINTSMPFPTTFGGPTLSVKDSILSVYLVRENSLGDNRVGVRIDFDFDLKFKEITVNDGFRYERDKLVKEGKLDYPLSSSEEYHQILMNQIEYWDGEKFVKMIQINFNRF